MKKPVVGIIMGSASDLPIMAEAARVLESLNIPHEVTVVSAHRTPRRAFEYASRAVSRGLKVIIAGAGGAAHLPGVMAALTTVPVIGVPIKSANSIEGLDSILSILQMPGGIPVATVGLNAAQNAGILAAQILAVSDKSLARNLSRMKARLGNRVEESARDIARAGYKKYLQEKK